MQDERVGWSDIISSKDSNCVKTDNSFNKYFIYSAPLYTNSSCAPPNFSDERVRGEGFFKLDIASDNIPFATPQNDKNKKQGVKPHLKFKLSNSQYLYYLFYINHIPEPQVYILQWFVNILYLLLEGRIELIKLF